MPHVWRPVSACYKSVQRAGREVFSLSSPWGRVHISFEMREAIANLQSLYKHHGRVFYDGPYEPSNVSLHTGGRDPQRQSSAGHEVPSCHATADSRASEQDSSLDAPSRHGSSRYVPCESVDHRADLPKAVVEAGRSAPRKEPRTDGTGGDDQRKT